MNKILNIKKEYELPMLCNDVIFKSLFTGLESILEKFIYDITGNNINNITLHYNEIPITRGKEKFKRCDFLIKKDNIIYNIELNSSYYDTLLIKNTSYIFSLFTSDISRGKDYNKDLNVIQININNFTKHNKPILDYSIINNNYGYNYLDSLKIWDLDIVKCKKMYYNERIRKRRHIKWGALFSCNTLEEMIPIIDELLTKRECEIFMDKLDKITKEEHIMSEAEALRLDDMLRRSIKKEGEEIGRNMLNDKFDLKTISRITCKPLS